MAYSKLYSSIVHSSLWTEADNVRLLFITLLAIADREGFVYGSKRGLERLANIRNHADTADDEDPWEALMSPDSDSSDLMRNPENEGRRIEEIPGGFRILNYLYYRGLRNDDDRRIQNREAQRKHREKVSLDKPKSDNISKDKQSASASASASVCTKKRSPENEEVCVEYCTSLGLKTDDGKWFWEKGEGCGWKNNGKAILDWKATVRAWRLANIFPSQKQMASKPAAFQKPVSEHQEKLDREYEEAQRLYGTKRTK